MSTYGSGLYGAGPYGGATIAGPVFDTLSTVQVWVWDKTDIFKGLYQAGMSSLVGLDFSHTERGCGGFSIQFADYVDIEKADRIKIKLYDDYIFSGVVREIPIEGSTSSNYVYAGFGYNDYFSRLNTGSRTYTSKTISYILNDLLTNVITPNSPIAYNITKLLPPAVTITSLVCHYNQVVDALDALLKIANSTGDEYLYGVDASGDFFFRERSSDIKALLSTGETGDYKIPAYDPKDSSEEITKLYVLKKDGTYWTTLSSLLSNDIFEEKVTGPDIADADLTLWATGILKDRERTIRSASIEWPLFVGTPTLTADGWLRIISTIPPEEQGNYSATAWGDGAWGDGIWGGSEKETYHITDDTLAIKQVTYKINDKEATRNIELGAIPLVLMDTIVEVNKKYTDLAISLGR